MDGHALLGAAILVGAVIVAGVGPRLFGFVNRKCRACGGSGRRWAVDGVHWKPCRTCKGEGDILG